MHLKLRAEGKSAKEIAKATESHPAYTTRLTAKYQHGGISAVADNKYGGNHRYLSFEEEAELLNPFQEKAEKGQIVEVSELKARFEQEVGHTTGGSQIYYVLRRHGWRKVMPRGGIRRRQVRKS